MPLPAQRRVLGGCVFQESTPRKNTPQQNESQRGFLYHRTPHRHAVSGRPCHSQALENTVLLILRCTFPWEAGPEVSSSSPRPQEALGQGQPSSQVGMRRVPAYCHSNPWFS